MALFVCVGPHCFSLPSFLFPPFSSLLPFPSFLFSPSSSLLWLHEKRRRLALLITVKMQRIPLSEVCNTNVDHDLADIRDAFIVLLSPCTKIDTEPHLQATNADVSDPFYHPEKIRKI